jgi:hypothetical protein
MNVDDRLKLLRQKIESIVIDDIRDELINCINSANPQQVIIWTRNLAEKLTQQILKDIGEKPSEKFDSCINYLEQQKVMSRGLVPNEIISSLHTLRIWGNKANHGGMRIKTTLSTVDLILSIVLQIVDWYHTEFERGPKISSLYKKEKKQLNKRCFAISGGLVVALLVLFPIVGARVFYHDSETYLRNAAEKRAAIAQAQLPKGPLRILTGAGVYLRQQLQQKGKKDQLQIGTIVSELKNTIHKGKLWYQVKTPDNKKGWISRKYSMSFDPDKRAQAYIKIAKFKLNNNKTTFGDLVDLYNFLKKASDTVELESAVELKLLSLLTLQKSLNYILISPFNESHLEWLNERQKEIVHNKSKNGWIVKKSLFFQLHDKYSFLPEIATMIIQKSPD